MDIIKPNLDKFNGAEITYQPDFKVPINKTMIKGNNKNNTFKILLNENYNYFITSLKKNITFKFNHYKRYNKTFSEEYIKNNGEESDINHWHNNSFNTGELLSFRFNNNKKDYKEYKKSNLLKILGAQDNIEYEPKDFKIKDDFLSKKKHFWIKNDSKRFTI